MEAGVRHIPVLLREVVDLLRPAPGGTFIDCTVGGGGHAEAILDAVGSDGQLLAFDRDPDAVAAARDRLSRFGPRVRVVHEDYRSIADSARKSGFFAVDGIVADLGLSSMQLEDPDRGFSFKGDGPLDMRMDPSSEDPTAADLLATLSETEIRTILKDYGEERLARPIARALWSRAESAPIRTCRDLAELVETVAGPAARRFAIHPATRTFQALRIAVNRELVGLDAFVRDATSLLRRGGRLCVISFHSLEDRIVKHAMRGLAERCICPPGLPICGCGRENIAQVLTAKPTTPSRGELEANPRARSAKLRALERV
jgi:16S rRNA (cytosine1402-N4)-methyltransferase